MLLTKGRIQEHIFSCSLSRIPLWILPSFKGSSSYIVLGLVIFSLLPHFLTYEWFVDNHLLICNNMEITLFFLCKNRISFLFKCNEILVYSMLFSLHFNFAGFLLPLFLTTNFSYNKVGSSISIASFYKPTLAVLFK